MCVVELHTNSQFPVELCRWLHSFYRSCNHSGDGERLLTDLDVQQVSSITHASAPECCNTFPFMLRRGGETLQMQYVAPAPSFYRDAQFKQAHELIDFMTPSRRSETRENYFTTQRTSMSILIGLKHRCCFFGLKAFFAFEICGGDGCCFWCLLICCFTTMVSHPLGIVNPSDEGRNMPKTRWLFMN